MPSAYEPARKQELLDRLTHLTPDAPARWGRFDAPRMVLHLIEAMRMASGELSVPPRNLPLLFLVRPLVIHVLPFPKGAPTSPTLLQRKPAGWDQDLAELRALIAAVHEPSADAKLPEHPAFGRMSANDWGVLIYKHCDHHYRQFGI